MKPCDNALAAMPGDTIFWGNNGESNGIVKCAGWKPSPKGGKIWTYEIEGGDFVPNEIVCRVEKPTVNYKGTLVTEAQTRIEDIHSMPSEVFLHQELLQIAESLNLAPTYRVVFSCILNDDLENIEVAIGLLKLRARQLRELEKLSAPSVYGNFGKGFGPNVENTQQPLSKEDKL